MPGAGVPPDPGRDPTRIIPPVPPPAPPRVPPPPTPVGPVGPVGPPPGGDPNRVMLGVLAALAVILLILLVILFVTRGKKHSSSSSTGTTVPGATSTTSTSSTSTSTSSTSTSTSTTSTTTSTTTTTTEPRSGNRAPNPAEQAEIQTSVDNSYPGYSITLERISDSDSSWAALRFEAQGQQTFEEVRHRQGQDWQKVTQGTSQVACDPSVPSGVQQDFSDLDGFGGC